MNRGPWPARDLGDAFKAAGGKVLVWGPNSTVGGMTATGSAGFYPGGYQLVSVPKWNRLAARTALARPSSSASAKCCSVPAPPLAITGTVTAIKAGADGSPLVEITQEARQQDGELSATGVALVQLPSRG